jgi:hypothetical protein
MRVFPVVVFFCGSVAMAQPISFGVRGGVPLTGAFANSIGVDVSTASGSHNYLVGPMVEVHLPLGFSVEADGLYHPLTLSQTIVTASPFHNSYNFQSWEFPILAKYRFLHTPVVKPLIEAGPTFRTTSEGLNQFSKAGFVVGGGVEIKIAHLRIEPDIRYIRWGSDSIVNGENFSPSDVNQAQFGVGVSF